MFEELLADREERHHLIRSLLLPGKTIVSLQANIPGPEKQIKEAYVLIGLFHPLIKHPRIDAIRTLDGADGPCILYLIDDPDANSIKQQMTDLEETHVLGRFIDLDVHGKATQSLSRGTLRRCFLCGKPAFVCAREQTHPLAELVDHIRVSTRNYLRQEIRRLVDLSILDELNLDPKFGLVTPTSVGSHPDMNYAMMISAKNTLLEPFCQMFLAGYESEDVLALFHQIRAIGKEAETSMRKSTGGINAYKGLIFSLGLYVAATGYGIAHSLNLFTIPAIIQKMTIGILDELSQRGTAGLDAYHRYGIGGARKEASLGYPSVQIAKTLLTDFSRERLTMTLLSLISTTEDTVLLKRCGSLETYVKTKETMAQVTVYDEKRIQTLTKWCLAKNLSFGGAADLLVVTCFLSRLDKFWQNSFR